MQYVACVKLVGIELATSMPVQYDIPNVVSGRGTVEGRGVSAGRYVQYTYVSYALLP